MEPATTGVRCRFPGLVSGLHGPMPAEENLRAVCLLKSAFYRGKVGGGAVKSTL